MPLHVAMEPPESADDDALVERLTALINRVYREGESRMWRDGTERTDAAEVSALVRAGEIALARQDGAVVGGVRVRDLDADTAEFGLLAADPAVQGQGVGATLVRFAEQRSRERGRTEMGLELLVPRTWTSPHKAFLKAWYLRMGFKLTGTVAIADHYPHLVAQLATEADVELYRKPLTA